MTTNVPAPTFGPNGFIIPTDEEILTGTQEDLNDAFGGNLNPSLETPQGQLATSMAAIVSEVDQMFLFYTTQTDPAFAMGRMQDAIGRIYFIERLPAQPTSVECTCTGLSGTVIPTGAQAVSADGNIYSCTAGGTIPGGGSITLPFACNTVGPIACPANTLDQIFLAIPGWDTINNPSDGVIGTNTESRSAFEARRAASVALNSIGSLPSVLGAVLAVPDVLDAYVTENDTTSPITIGSGAAAVTLNANSLYVAASGGDPQAIANAIWSKKAPGCAYYSSGNTTETVTDNSPGYNPPFPTYTVKFEVPPSLPILFAVDILPGPNVPSNYQKLIQNAIISAFAGGDGGQRAKIGSTILASRFIAPIAALGPWALVKSIFIGSSNAPNASFTGVIAGTALTATSITGTIAIGQTLQGAGIPDGVTIVSGSGGSWVISTSLTISSEAMTTTLPSSSAVAVGIAQAPTVSDVNIAVTNT